MKTDKTYITRSSNLVKSLFRTKFRVFLLLVIGALFTASYGFFNFPRYSTSKLETAKAEGLHSDSERKDHMTQKLIVDTSTCKIPEMDPRDPSIRDFLYPDIGFPVDCKGTHRTWTFMNETILTLNSSAVHESGYSVGSIHCCYRTIERVEQPLSDYNMNADNYIKYSDKCYPLKNGSAKIDAEFIRVHCISKSFPFINDVVYRDFFAIAQPAKDRLVARKLENWKSKQGNSSSPPPPNVVIVGIDNNSRMNSHRHLKETLQVLKSLGAVELLGYTKVAENTFPNTVPILSGYSAEEIEPICYTSNEDPQDDCPYVWKAFDQLDYLTVHAEDAPYVGGFNYLKTGFLRKPTDFYLRSLFLAVMTYLPRFDYYHTDCIGRVMTEEFVFNYMLDVIKLASAHSAPVFIHSWLTSLAHHNYNNLQFGDKSIADLLKGLVHYSNDNTIFFFVSDHGQRFGPIRETNQGWLEDKLPTHFVYMPAQVKKSFPEWEISLQKNSKRLTSHFDLYKTMLHVLKSYDKGLKLWSFYDADPIQKGQSLFKPVPENRTCDDAGVTINFCACAEPVPIDKNSVEIVKAANAAVAHLAIQIPSDVCAEPTLKSIVNARYMDIPARPVYIVSFYTDPGDFLFEVNVEKELSTGNYVITTDLLRMNKISRAASCVSTPLLERYCYCK